MAERITKAEAVREYLRKHPRAKPAAVVTGLGVEGVDVTAHYVTKVKTSSRRASARRSSKAKPKKKGGRGRPAANARYPRHGVKKVLRIPEAIFAQNAGRSCTVVQAAEFLGVGVSGDFKTEVSSAIKYGLLERPKKGQIEPTDLAKMILRPQHDADELQGIQTAVLQAPQISDVYKHYRGENIPEAQFFKNTVVETYAVPEEKVEEFRQIFSEVLNEAQLLQKHGDKTRVVDVTEEDSTKDKTATMKKLGRGVKVSPSQTCFVMQPFAPPLGDSYDKIYKPAIEKAGLTSIRADADLFGTGKIIDQIWRGIKQAEVLVAELTGRNPNVFYELGLAHALQKPVVLISSNEEDVPFDLQHIRVIYYVTSDPFWGSKLIDKVAENIISAIRNPEEAMLKSGDL